MTDETEAPITPGDPAELERAALLLVPEPEPNPEGAPQPATPPSEGTPRTDVPQGPSAKAGSAGHPDDDELAEALIDQAEAMATDANLLAALTEEDIAATLELVFGIASDFRGPHWEMPAEGRSAKRLAKWIKRSIERHGGLPVWLEKWFPDIMVALIAMYELRTRWSKDGAAVELKAAA